MKSKRLAQHDGATTWVIVLDKGDEVVKPLTGFAKQHGITAAHFTGIGAFSEVTLGYFERDTKAYKKIPVREQVEVLSLIGDIAREDGAPKLHAHTVLGTSDGSARGGHLLEARVWPTLEIILTESPKHLRKRMDPDVGLALIDLEAV